MGTVIFMKFNDEQGALVADESTWHLGFKYGYRRSNYGDSIFSLLDEETAKKSNMSVVYAGVGFPSFHYEVAKKGKTFFDSNIEHYKSLVPISEKLHEIYCSIHKRYVDDKLKFFFDFNTDQLNSLNFKKNEKDYEIKQEGIISEAKKIIKYHDKSPGANRVFDNNGFVMGYDKRNGISGYWLDKDRNTMDFASHLGVLGSGNQVAIHVYSNVTSKMNLTERRNGFDMMDGLYLLLNTAVEIKNTNYRFGGYFQITLIDGTSKYFKTTTKEILNHNAHLVSEIIQANLWGFINKKDTYELMQKLLFEDVEYNIVEQEFFAKVSDLDTVRKYLMGYKPVNQGIK